MLTVLSKSDDDESEVVPGEAILNVIVLEPRRRRIRLLDGLTLSSRLKLGCSLAAGEINREHGRASL